MEEQIVNRYRDQYRLASAQLLELRGFLQRVLDVVKIGPDTGELSDLEGDLLDVKDVTDAVSAVVKIHKAERETLLVVASLGQGRGASRASLIEDADNATSE